MAELNAVTTVATSGATRALDAASAIDPVFDVTMNANCAFSLAAPAIVRMQTVTLYLRQDATGGRAPSFPSSVGWSGGNVPSFNTLAGRYDVVQLVTVNSGASWLGSMVAYGAFTPSVAAAPSITITPGANTNKITIADGSNGGSAITAHKIYRGTVSGTLSLIATYPIASGNIYDDNGLTNGTQYFYKVVAVNAIGDSPQSAEVSGTPILASTTRLNFPANSTSAYYTPTNPVYTPGSSTLDVQCRMSFASWVAARGSILNTWQQVSTVIECWDFYFDGTTGRPSIQWRTSAGIQVAAATAAVPFADSAVGWVRATVAPSTGVGTFYTSTDGSTWTQLGSPVNAAAGDIVQFGTPARAIVGGQHSNSSAQLTTCQIYESKVLIGGTVVANPVFAGQAVGTTSFTDAAGKVWTIVSPVAITAS